MWTTPRLPTRRRRGRPRPRHHDHPEQPGPDVRADHGPHLRHEQPCAWGSRSRSRAATSSARAAAPRWCTARSTGPSPAARTASSTSRWTARAVVRTFSSGRMRPCATCNNGFTASAVPSSAAAAPIRPPRRSRSRVSTREEDAAPVRDVGRRLLDGLDVAAGVGGVRGGQHCVTESHRSRPRVDDPDAPSARPARPPAAPRPTCRRAPGTGAPTRRRPRRRRALRCSSPRSRRGPAGRSARRDAGRRARRTAPRCRCRNPSRPTRCAQPDLQRHHADIPRSSATPEGRYAVESVTTATGTATNFMVTLARGPAGTQRVGAGRADRRVRLPAPVHAVGIAVAAEDVLADQGRQVQERDPALARPPRVARSAAGPTGVHGPVGRGAVDRRQHRDDGNARAGS